MPLTEPQQSKASQWFGSKVKNHTCPSCGGERWTLENSVVAPLATSFEEQHVGPQIATTPLIGFYCRDCGYIRLYSAQVMGLP